jgi:serine/threonine protein phosphatase PrpC/LysM repeat protein
MAKTQELKNFDFGNATDIGLVRSENEDYLGYFHSINGHVFIVCDGMGGHSGGAEASRLVVESIRAYLENHYFDLPQDAMIAGIEFANSVVYKKSRDNQALQGMGTTIVIAIIRNDVIYYAHVGDSRIYLYSDKQMHQLTRDHSYVQKLVDEGTITEAEARVHPDKNVITRVIGIQPDVEIDMCESPCYPAIGDMLLMCTDGLTNSLTDEEIAQALEENLSVQHKAIKLCQLANDQGGLDNTTLQLVLFFNVANKKSKFVDARGLKLDKKPDNAFIKTYTPEPEIKENPIVEKTMVETPMVESPQEEPVKTPVIEETQTYTKPLIHQLPPDDEPPQKEIQSPSWHETQSFSKPETESTPVNPLYQTQQTTNDYAEPEKESKGFFQQKIDKLNLSDNKKKKLKIILITIAVVFIAYIFWDLFIKESAGPRLALTESKDSTTTDVPKDTVASANIKDTVKHTPPKPNPKNGNQVVNSDTNWISYSVKKGDVLGKISTKFGIPLSFIKKKNKLKNDNIAENQKLMIPIKANYAVKPGDNFNTIATKFKVAKAAIMRSNDIKDEKSIKVGKDLVIPFK